MGAPNDHHLMARLEDRAKPVSLAESDFAPWAPSEAPQELGPRPGERSVTIDALTARIEQLEVALEHRTVISSAVGMLAERFGMGIATAFSVLSRISQETNRKVYDLAAELTSTGHTETL